MESVTLSRAQKSLDIAKKVADNKQQIEDGKEYPINLSLIGAEKDTVKCISGTVTFKNGVGKVSNNLFEHLGMGATLSNQNGNLTLNGQNTQNFAVSSNFNGINIVGREKDEKEDLKDLEGNHLKKEDINLKNTKDAKSAHIQLYDKKFKQKRQEIQDLRAESNALLNKDFQETMRNMPKLFRMLQFLEDRNYKFAKSQAAAQQFGSNRYGMSIDAFYELEYMHKSIHDMTAKAMEYERMICSDCNDCLTSKNDALLNFNIGGKSGVTTQAIIVNSIVEAVNGLKREYPALSGDRILDLFFPTLPKSIADAVRSSDIFISSNIVDQVIGDKKIRSTGKSMKGAANNLGDYIASNGEAGSHLNTAKMNAEEMEKFIKIQKAFDEKAPSRVVLAPGNISTINPDTLEVEIKTKQEFIKEIDDQVLLDGRSRVIHAATEAALNKTNNYGLTPETTQMLTRNALTEFNVKKAEEDIVKSTAKIETQLKENAPSQNDNTFINDPALDSINSNLKSADPNPVGAVVRDIMVSASVIHLNGGTLKFNDDMMESLSEQFTQNNTNNKTPQSGNLFEPSEMLADGYNLKMPGVESSYLHKSVPITSDSSPTEITPLSTTPAMGYHADHDLVDWSKILSEQPHMHTPENIHFHEPKTDPEMETLMNELQKMSEQQDQELTDLDASFDERTLKLVFKHLKFSREAMRNELYEYSNQLQADKKLTPTKRKQKLLIAQEKIKQRQSKELLEKLLKQKFIQRQLYAQLLLKHSKSRSILIKKIEAQADKCKNHASNIKTTPVVGEETIALIANLFKEKNQSDEIIKAKIRKLVAEGRIDEAKELAEIASQKHTVFQAQISKFIEEHPAIAESMHNFNKNMIPTNKQNLNENYNDYFNLVYNENRENTEAAKSFDAFKKQIPGYAALTETAQVEMYCAQKGFDLNPIQIAKQSFEIKSIDRDTLADAMTTKRSLISMDDQLKSLRRQAHEQIQQHFNTQLPTTPTVPTGPLGPQ